MHKPSPTVEWKELQRRKLQVMSETVEHFKEVAGLKLLIQPNVYPPGTDTHLLASTVRVVPGDVALDLCTGTGVIAFKMAVLGAKNVLGTDLNPRSIENARRNKELLGLKNVSFEKRDIFDGLENRYDVICINPPYTDIPASNDIDICFFDENHKSLKKFFSGLKDRLKPNGRAYLAWSNIGPMDLIPKLAKEYGFSLEEIASDIGGRGYTFYVYRLEARNE